MKVSTQVLAVQHIPNSSIPVIQDEQLKTSSFAVENNFGQNKSENA